MIRPKGEAMDHRDNAPIAWIGLLFLIAIGVVSYRLRSTSSVTEIPTLAGSSSRPVDLGPEANERHPTAEPTELH